MSEPTLETRFKALTHEMATIQARLNELENRPPGSEPTPVTSRRRMLRRLAGGLAAAVATGSATLASSSVAQASSVVNPASGNNQIGTLIVSPGQPLPTGNPPAGKFFGLVVTDGSNLSLNSLYTGNAGVSGLALGTGSNGVAGYSSGSNSSGVYGFASGSNCLAVYGFASGTNSFAGYFSGNVSVSGSVSKSGGSFKIDHPLDPANQYLYHSFVESPDMLNIYNGLVTLDAQGTATVELPAWFETLNADFRYGLTAIGQPSPNLYIAEEVKGGQFKIAGGQAGQRVSWQLTGVRQDEWAKAHRIPIEETKSDREKGLYLHPELFGQPEDKAIHRKRL